MTVSDFHILIKSCSIESRNDPSPKSEVVHETKKETCVEYEIFKLNFVSGIILVNQ